MAINNTVQNSYSLSPAALAGAKKNKLGEGLSIAPSGSVTRTPKATPAPQQTQAVRGLLPDVKSSLAPVSTMSAPSSGKEALLSSLYSQLGEKQAQLKQVQERESRDLRGAERNAVKGAEDAATIPTYQGLIGQLAGTATQGTTGVQKAIDQLRGFRENAAEYKAGIYSAPTSARVMQGRDAMVQQTNALREAALASGVESALTGQGQQLTALGTAAGLAAPSVAEFGRTVFNPLTGQYESGGADLDPQTQASTFAEKVMGGSMTYDQAMASMGYAGAAGKTFLDNAIIGAGGNPLQLQASGAAQQSITGTRDTATTDIARQGLQTATNDYMQMFGASQFADSQARAVEDILARTGLNNVSSRDYTRAINSLRGRFSDPEFAALNTALREAQIAYTNLLSTGGGTPTGREEAALATLDVNQSAQFITASIQELENAVARRLQAQEGVMAAYQQNLGSSGTQSTQSGGNIFAEQW